MLENWIYAAINFSFHTDTHFDFSFFRWCENLFFHYQNLPKFKSPDSGSPVLCTTRFPWVGDSIRQQVIHFQRFWIIILSTNTHTWVEEKQRLLQAAAEPSEAFWCSRFGFLQRGKYYLGFLLLPSSFSFCKLFCFGCLFLTFEWMDVAWGMYSWNFDEFQCFFFWYRVDYFVRLFIYFCRDLYLFYDVVFGFDVLIARPSWSFHIM